MPKKYVEGRAKQLLHPKAAGKNRKRCVHHKVEGEHMKASALQAGYENDGIDGCVEPLQLR